MPTDGVNNINYDGSCSRIYWHMTKFGGMVSLDLPDVKKKVEKIALLGEQYQTVVTPGMFEVGDAVATFTAVGWKKALGRLPDRYGDIEFPITTNERHVTVTAGYSTILDRCAIIGVKGGKLENSEKGRLVEVTMRVMLVHEKGESGGWKTAGRRPGESPLASPAAQALMF